MSTQETALNSLRFDGDAGGLKLATDVLFNRGFKRYRLTLVPDVGESRTEVVWAKDRKQVARTFNRRGFLLVQIEEMPIGRFFAQSRAGDKRWMKEFVWRDEQERERRDRVTFQSVESAGDWVLWPEDMETAEAGEERAG